MSLLRYSILFLAVFTGVLPNLFSQNCSNLFISEYLEGTSSNKAIEIFNPTSSTINLSGYTVEIYNNGSPTSTSIQLSGFIPQYSTYVLANSSADQDIIDRASQTSGSVSFNGNDAIALVNTNNNDTLDIFGVVGQDPGNGWLANGANWTANNTLRRNFSVVTGLTSNPSIFTPNSEWDSLGVDVTSSLGFHENLCLQSANLDCFNPFISEYIEGTGNNKAIEIYNPRGSVVSLEGVVLEIFNNGSQSSSSSIDLSNYTIPAFGTFLVVNPNAGLFLTGNANLITGSLAFNGNDAIALTLNDSIYFDLIGVIGENPGLAWTDSSTNENWTIDHTMRRKESINKGIADPFVTAFEPSDEWELFPIDNFSDAGLHYSTCEDDCSLLLTSIVENTSTVGGSDGSVEITVTGGSLLEYTWSNGATTSTIAGLSEGTYSVTVTDIDGCEIVESINVDGPNCSLSISSNIGNVSFAGADDGSITVAVDNATDQIVYNWSNGATTQNLTDLSEGQYSLTVTDSLGCEASETFDVSVESNCILILDSFMVSNVSCFGENDGSISVSPLTIDSILFSEFFDSGIPADWQVSDLDGQTSFLSEFSSGSWISYDNDFNPNVGDSVVASSSWYTPAGTSNDWLVSPRITLTEENVLRWVASSSSSVYPDGYEVMISTTTPDISSFYANPPLFSIEEEQVGWIERILNLSDKGYENQDVYIAFVNNTYDGVILYVDEMIVASGTSGTFSYEWSTGETTSSINNLSEGNYEVTITDSDGCIITESFNISQPDSLYIDFLTTNETGTGNSDGTIQTVIYGAVDPIEYLWETNDTIGDLENLSAGVYTLLIENGNGCQVLDSTTVGIDSVICNFVVGANTTDETAFQALDGTAEAIPNGGTSPFTYVWSNGETTNPVAGLAPNTYRVTVTDANGCTQIATIEINAFPDPCSGFELNISSENESSQGANNGSASVSLLGGTTPYSYNWSNGETQQNIANLEPGTYTITATDSLGCSITASTEVLAGVECTISVVGLVNNASSINDADGSIELTVNGNIGVYTVNWDNGNTNPLINDSLLAGDYIVSITDSIGCTVIDTFVVDVDSVINTCNLVTTVSTINESAAGSNDGSASVSTTGGTSPFTYLWSNGATLNSVNNLSPGSYSVTVNDSNGCADTNSFSILPFTDTVITCNLILNVIIENESSLSANDGTAESVITNGTQPINYNWSNGETTQNISNLAPGNYSLTVSDSLECTDSVNFEILAFVDSTNSCDLSLEVITADETTVNGNNGFAGAIITNGTQPYIYNWSNGDTQQNIDSLAPGNYSLSVIDSLGCTDSVDFVILPFDPCNNLQVSVNGTDETASGANDGSAVANVTGGSTPYTYSWSNGSSTSTISSLTPLTYYVTVTDNGGCTVEDSIQISPFTPIPCNLIIDLSTTDETAQSANDGSATAMGMNGVAPYTYNWSTGETTSTINNLTPGSYQIVVSDSVGCSDSLNFIINAFDSTTTTCNLELTVIAVAESAAGANDGEALSGITNGTAPFSYLWSTGDTTINLDSLSPGNYSVTVIDSEGCSDSSSFVIDPFNTGCTLEVGILTTNETSTGSADGSAGAEPINGTAPYEFLWSTGDTTVVINDLTAGEYTVSITDANGCVSSAVATIIVEGCDLTATVTSTAESFVGANDGSASVFANNGSAPYTYNWSNSETTSMISDLEPGTYSVTVTDSTSCSVIKDVVVNSGLCTMNITASATAVTQIGANDGEASVAVTGGTNPISISWSNGSTTSTITNLSAGNYTVTVVDSLGCTETAVATVSAAGCDLSLELSTTNETSQGSEDGAATVDVSNGSGSYSFEWSNGGLTSTITNLAGGTYDVTVTDDSTGCIASRSIEVHSCALEASIGVTGVSSAGATDGSLIAFVSGGTSPYSYEWNNGLGTSGNVTNIGEGTYVLFVTDGKGCIDSDTAEVTVDGVGFEDIFNNSSLAIYPNPTKDNATVALTLLTTENIEVQVLNNVGQVMYTKEYNSVNSIEQFIDCTNWSTGVYLVKIQSKGYFKTSRFIVK